MTFTGTRNFTAQPEGAFARWLRPGTYKVTATSPAYLGGRGTCEATHRIRVTEGGNRPVKVFCQLR